MLQGLQRCEDKVLSGSSLPRTGLHTNGCQEEETGLSKRCPRGAGATEVSLEGWLSFDSAEGGRATHEEVTAQAKAWRWESVGCVPGAGVEGGERAGMHHARSGEGLLEGLWVARAGWLAGPGVALREGHGRMLVGAPGPHFSEHLYLCVHPSFQAVSNF